MTVASREVLSFTADKEPILQWVWIPLQTPRCTTALRIAVAVGVFLKERWGRLEASQRAREERTGSEEVL